MTRSGRLVESRSPLGNQANRYLLSAEGSQSTIRPDIIRSFVAWADEAQISPSRIDEGTIVAYVVARDSRRISLGKKPMSVGELRSIENALRRAFVATKQRDVAPHGRRG